MPTPKGLVLHAGAAPNQQQTHYTIRGQKTLLPRDEFHPFLCRGRTLFASEQSFENRLDELGISTAAGLFHHLAHEEGEDFFVAGAVFGDCIHTIVKKKHMWQEALSPLRPVLHCPNAAERRRLSLLYDPLAY